MIFIKQILCGLILMSDNNPSWFEKIMYYLQFIIPFTVIAYITDELTGWFTINRLFVNLLMLCIFCNLIVGVWFHLKMKSFSWYEFLFKNSTMIGVILLSYMMLESLLLISGKNVLIDGFRTVIQVSTLLYPCSKAFKNMYILTNKQFPPEFLMNRIYKFEKSGNLNDLYPKDNDENN